MSLTLQLPEPPALNAMIDMAKERTRRTRTGGWMPRALPVVYDQRKETYELLCDQALGEQRIRKPRRAWPRWRILRVEFRVHGRRDPIELMAGLKWPVDWLVARGFVAGDADEELVEIPKPQQRIDRRRRGITLVIEEVLPEVHDQGATP